MATPRSDAPAIARPRDPSQRGPSPRGISWPAYGAYVWSLLFAAMSFYWAAGGTIGIDTQAPGIAELARERDPGFVAVLWVTGLLKLLGVPLALALVQPWGRVFPRWMLLTAAWGAGAGMVLWGGLNLCVGVGVGVLRAAGVVDPPEDTSAFWWHLLLWDPWWILGGVLFLMAAWQYRRRTRTPRDPSD